MSNAVWEQECPLSRHWTHLSSWGPLLGWDSCVILSLLLLFSLILSCSGDPRRIISQWRWNGKWSSKQAHCREGSQHSALCVLRMLGCRSQPVLTWKSHELCKECPQRQVVVTGRQGTRHWPKSWGRTEQPLPHYFLGHQIKLTPFQSPQLTVSISSTGTKSHPCSLAWASWRLDACSTV